MFDARQRLSESLELQALLTHYATLAQPDRQAWHDRRMTLGDGGDGRLLTRLHGELLAYGWLEINLEPAPQARLDEAPACYRVTSQGRHALDDLDG